MQTNRMMLDDVGGLDIFMLMARALTTPGMLTRPENRDRYSVPTASPVRRAKPKIGLLARLDRWFLQQRQRDVETFLAQATDIYDVERRMRALERGFAHPYY